MAEAIAAVESLPLKKRLRILPSLGAITLLAIFAGGAAKLSPGKKSHLISLFSRP